MNIGISDEELMERVQGGEFHLLELLLKRYDKALFGYAQRVVLQRDEAEDALQETFLKVFRNRASYRPGSAFRPWLYTVCLNVCRDQLRKKLRRPESELEKTAFALADPEPGPEQVSTQSLLGQRIRQAVEALPEKQREVFLLSHYQQLSQAEISTILDIPVGTVKSRLFHACRALAHSLEDLRSSRI